MGWTEDGVEVDSEDCGYTGVGMECSQSESRVGVKGSQTTELTTRSLQCTGAVAIHNTEGWE